MIEAIQRHCEEARRKRVRLNLGCGAKLLAGYINCDITGQVDQIIDLSKFPWPFESESVDEILMEHCLEHLPDTYAVMTEVKRILRQGGVFRGEVPYCNSITAFDHPQHYRFFSEKAFVILAWDFQMELNQSRLATYDFTLTYKLRNLLPAWIRKLRHSIMNCFDKIEFEFQKPHGY